MITMLKSVGKWLAEMYEAGGDMPEVQPLPLKDRLARYGLAS